MSQNPQAELIRCGAWTPAYIYSNPSDAQLKKWVGKLRIEVGT